MGIRRQSHPFPKRSGWLPQSWKLGSGRRCVHHVLRFGRIWEVQDDERGKESPRWSREREEESRRAKDGRRDGEEKRKEGKVFVIQPKSPVNISRVEKNKDKLKALYNEGYEDAKKSYADLMKFLNEN